MNDEPLTKIKNDFARKAENILMDYKYSDLKLQAAKDKLAKKIAEVNVYID